MSALVPYMGKDYSRVETPEKIIETSKKACLE